jgi:hypothetical protein
MKRVDYFLFEGPPNALRLERDTTNLRNVKDLGSQDEKNV